jgi:hypothetical protein
MKKIIAFLPIILITITSYSQTISGKLKFGQGQTLEVTLHVKSNIAQQAMSQAIDFDAEGSAIHLFKVTNAVADNTTLHHQVKHISFDFDGMGQKRSFDSGNQKDLDGSLGKPMKEILSKSYDMIIDPSGKVLLVKPEKTDNAKMEGPMMLIGNMLKDLLDVVQPPQKANASFFKVFPDNAVKKGDNWTESYENTSGKFNTIYTLSEITDSAYVINFTGNSATSSKSEMMGSEATTNMNNKTTGKIIVDKTSGIIRQKTSVTESTGTMELMKNTVPVNSKTTIEINVKKM